MRALGLGAAVVALVAGLHVRAAVADGPPDRASGPYIYPPPAVLTYDWTGLYVGGHLGAANTHTKWTYDGTPGSILLGGLPEAINQSDKGFVGGGFVGLQKQWSWIVVGAEAAYLWIDQSQATASQNAADTTLMSSVRNVFLITGKFGWNWENILAYFKGGWAMGDVEFRTSTTSTGALLTSSTGRENGWTAGAGLEYALWEHVILGVEYNYVELNTGTRAQIPAGTGPAGTHVNASLDIQSATARLSFKFGG